MQVIEQVPGLRDRGERQADRFELRCKLVFRMFLHHFRQLRQEPRALLHAHAVGLQAGISGKPGLAEFPAKDFPLSVGHDADEKAIAVAGLEDVVDAPGGALDRHRRRRLAGELVLRHVLGDEIGGALEKGARDALALSGRLALAQRGEDADRRESAAHDVDHRGAGAQRPVGQPGHVGEAAHHLRHLVERKAMLVRAFEEALERAVDQLRVFFPENFV